MRGEHTLNQRKAIEEEGSSPHARGAHLLNWIKLHWPGIIPACAGSTVFQGVLYA